MLFIENPTLIKFKLDDTFIEGTIVGTAADWEFISDNTKFRKIVGGNTLRKGNRNMPPNLLELDTKITQQIEKLLN